MHLEQINKPFLFFPPNSLRWQALVTLLTRASQIYHWSQYFFQVSIPKVQLLNITNEYTQFHENHLNRSKSLIW